MKTTLKPPLFRSAQNYSPQSSIPITSLNALMTRKKSTFNNWLTANLLALLSETTPSPVSSRTSSTKLTQSKSTSSSKHCTWNYRTWSPTNMQITWYKNCSACAIILSGSRLCKGCTKTSQTLWETSKELTRFKRWSSSSQTTRNTSWCVRALSKTFSSFHVIQMQHISSRRSLGCSRSSIRTAFSNLRRRISSTSLSTRTQCVWSNIWWNWSPSWNETTLHKRSNNWLHKPRRSSSTKWLSALTRSSRTPLEITSSSSVMSFSAKISAQVWPKWSLKGSFNSQCRSTVRVLCISVSAVTGLRSKVLTDWNRPWHQRPPLSCSGTRMGTGFCCKLWKGMRIFQSVIRFTTNCWWANLRSSIMTGGVWSWASGAALSARNTTASQTP